MDLLAAWQFPYQAAPIPLAPIASLWPLVDRLRHGQGILRAHILLVDLFSVGLYQRITRLGRRVELAHQQAGGPTVYGCLESPGPVI